MWQCPYASQSRQGRKNEPGDGATICHLGNIGRLLGSNLRWGPTAEKFLDDDEAKPNA